MADAVLYEGYLLYPYRKSSDKNRVRWQFGVLLPRGWLQAQGMPDDETIAGSAESWFQQSECLLEAPAGAQLTVRLRFLRIQARSVQSRTPDGFRAVAELDVAGEQHVPFDEAVPYEREWLLPLADALRQQVTLNVAAPGEETVEELSPSARVVRTSNPVALSVTIRAEQVAAPFRLLRLRIRTCNSGQPVSPRATREDALRSAAIATHTILGVDQGGFLSLLEPPHWAEHATRECRNVHTFPVLAGPPGSRDVVLSSPILLYDYPQIAPESPGDFHDAGEIDELLSLRTLTLSDAEKREARATDPRGAAIIERVDAMPPEVLQKLHGVIRSLRPAGQAATQVPWWEQGADDALSPEKDAIVIDGTAVHRGSRVRLHPRRRGTDAHDMFLAGRTAVVEAVLLDVDGSRHLAVTIDDDPAAELHQWYGRYRYFSPAEIEPLVAPPEAGS